MAKSMSDGEVNDFAFKKLMGDMDGIEASGLFDEKESEDKLAGDSKGVRVEAHGVSVHIKPMAGEQVKDAPKVEAAPDEEDVKLGE
jgi:hypothetical protein